MIDQVIPFRYLSRVQGDALLLDRTEDRFEPGEIIIHQGDEKGQMLPFKRRI